MPTDPTVVRDAFASHYFLFAFLASLGTLQIAVTISGARGLWLTPHPVVTKWLGIALIVAGVLVFFAMPLWIEGPWEAGSVEADSVTREWGQANWDELAGARNVNDIHGGLDGTKQAIWFPLAAILAFFSSAIVGSLTVRILNTADADSAEESHLSSEDDGVAGLVERDYFANLPISWRKFRADIKGVWDTTMSATDKWSVFKVLFGKSESQQ